MTTKETGGPAFPCDNIVERNEKGQLIGVEKSSAGLTMRDYFAAKAMQGFAADDNATWRNGIEGMAHCAYEWADAMLEARKS